MHFGRDDWWASTDLVLDDITTETLTDVVRKHKKQLVKGTIGPGKVIADLMLGTWVMLLSRGGTSALGRAIDYETNLWRPALRFGFATGNLHSDRSGPAADTRRCPPSEHRTSSGSETVRRTTSRSSTAFGCLALRPSVDQTVWDQTVELLEWMAPELAAIHEANPAVPNLLAARP